MYLDTKKFLRQIKDLSKSPQVEEVTSESWQEDQLSGSKGGGPLHKGSASRTGYLSEAGYNTVSDSGGGQGLWSCRWLVRLSV